MLTDKTYCWACKELGMELAEELGKGWRKCVLCGATEFHMQLSASKLSPKAMRRSARTGFKMPKQSRDAGSR